MMMNSQYTARRVGGATRTLMQSGLAAACMLAGGAAAAVAQDLSSLRPVATQAAPHQVSTAWDSGSGIKDYRTAPDAAAKGSESLESCIVDYQRADNMWAPLGQPSASLGTESISLTVGQKLTFITDWKYEKLRNDGTHFYGSHLRVATNRSSRPVRLEIRGWVGDVFNFSLRTYTTTLNPNTRATFKADLTYVLCQ